MTLDTTLETIPLPGLTEIHAAAEKLAAVAVQTPLLQAPALDRRTGGHVLIKAEMLQRTGSFKFRGAYNKISRIAGSEKIISGNTEVTGEAPTGTTTCASRQRIVRCFSYNAVPDGKNAI